MKNKTNNIIHRTPITTNKMDTPQRIEITGT